MHDLLSQCSSDFCTSIKEPMPFLPRPLTNPSNIFTNKAFNCLHDILNSFKPQPSFIFKIIHEFDSFPQTFQPPPHIPSSSEVLKTKWFLSDKLVIGAPDKIVGFQICIALPICGRICMLPFGIMFISKSNLIYLTIPLCHISNIHMIQITGQNLVHLIPNNLPHIPT